MKHLILLVLTTPLMMATFAQKQYSIHYAGYAKMRINSEKKIRGGKLYNVDFLDKQGRVIKTMERSDDDDGIQNRITYNFYQDSLLSNSIDIDLTDRSLSKTTIRYSNGKLVLIERFGSKPAISKDSFQIITDRDLLLNHPEYFPTAGLKLEYKLVKKYEKGNLVYQCDYAPYGRFKNAVPARVDSFTYNTKGQLIAHISRPLSPMGGTAHWITIFEYNNAGELIKRDYYENKKHFNTEEFEYSGNSFTLTSKHYDLDGPGDPNKYTTNTSVYTRGADGQYYTPSISYPFQFLPNME